MPGPIPAIELPLLRKLGIEVSRGILSRASLEAAASNMNVSLGEFMHALHAAQGEIGAQLSGGPTTEAAASFARQVYSASQALEGAGELASLEAAAAETATLSGSAGSVAGSVATGGRALGFFGRIGSVIGLTGGAATLAGIAATVITLGGLVYGGSIIAGEMSADSPTAEYGSAVNDPRGEPPAAPTNTVAEEPYAVYVLTNVSGGTIWISQESSLKSSLACQFEGGGLCASQGGSDRPVTYTKLSQDYFTRDAAFTDFCSAITSEPRNYELAFGTKATVYGGDYWIDLLPSCD
jgi:hypothetical protein